MTPPRWFALIAWCSGRHEFRSRFVLGSCTVEPFAVFAKTEEYEKRFAGHIGRILFEGFGLEKLL